MAYRLGVDVGGTFTDLLLVHDETGQLHRVKTPSTPADPSEGVLVGIDRICEAGQITPSDLAHVQHGTTVATNALLEAKGARVGLITTQGFGQILHLARSQTPGPLAGWIIMVKPEPPASLQDTREAKERMSAQGEAVEPVDRDQVKGIVRELVESGVESLTVSLINSYTNPAHEREIKAIIEELYPGFPVTISADVLPEFREYERTLTACMNSYVRPRVQAYVSSLENSLHARGVRGDLNLLRSDAGLMTAELASENPIYGILSGPSGGVAGALYVARRAGYDNVLTFDMGGTSTDVALCQDGQPTVERQTEVPYGLGLPGEVIPIKVPSLNVRSVGAGGGSIAHVPEVTGALRVGPQSAGADPGPACYGRGGEEPTVTDANVVVGHLPPQLLGGEMQLDVDAAKAAVQKIGEALGLDLHEAAEGILDIVNENMAGALRLVSVQRGYDPRDFALVAFGGAGPMHANAVARIMGSFPVLVPPAPGLLCATGDLVADFRNEFARTFIRTTDQVSGEELRAVLEQLGSEARDWLTREGIASEQQRVAFNVDMRYYRQGYEIPVEIDPALLAGDGTAMLADRFNQIHEQFYRFKMEDSATEIVNLRAIGYGEVPKPRLPEAAGSEVDASGAVIEEHEVYFQGRWLPTKIYDRSRLEPGNRIDGPAIVTEFDSTTVVLAGHTAEVDQFLNLLINPDNGQEASP
ncbi:MAG: hydantoinase/oxoprolinase family protein [Solirubrobacterales bacterium]|nr:hydantoinase/oxoprolinase family protein [Solirubrobacterales bacterium]MBV9796512.1 hydantoinase/oxoprolinase family protein [Solirubrobacterales bacterium]